VVKTSIKQYNNKLFESLKGVFNLA